MSINSKEDHLTGNTITHTIVAEDELVYLNTFRCAFTNNDLSAREWVEQHMHTTLLHWLHAHPSWKTIQKLNREDFYLTHTFACLWQIGEQQRIECNTLALAFQYLGMSLNSVLCEAVRLHFRSQVIADSSQAQQADTVQWEKVQTVLPTAREQRIAYLLYHCAFTPEEIVRLYPQEFPDTREITHVRLTLIKRMH